MRISEVAGLTGLNVSNIRFYEKKGLLTPVREEESRYRDYTEEDVRRIKRILLYRKMGIPVETIYLLLHGQAETSTVLERQSLELRQQMENLQGALELCRMVLRDGELEDGKLEGYLSYVHEEEGRGKQFAKAEELLEDIADYTKENVFRWNPGIVWLFQRPWLARLLSLGLWFLVLAVPLDHLFRVFREGEPLRIPLLLVYGVMIVVYGMGFLRFRKARQEFLSGEGRKK